MEWSRLGENNCMKKLISILLIMVPCLAMAQFNPIVHSKWTTNTDGTTITNVSLVGTFAATQMQFGTNINSPVSWRMTNSPTGLLQFQYSADGAAWTTYETVDSSGSLVVGTIAPRAGTLGINIGAGTITGGGSVNLTGPIVGGFFYGDGSGVSNAPLGTVTVSNQNATVFNFTNTASLPIGTVSNNVIVAGSNLVALLTYSVSAAGGGSTNADLAIKGAVGGIAANPGFVGETVDTTVLNSAPVALTTATPANMGSVVLSAGDWDIWATVCFQEAAASVTLREAGLNTTSATLPVTSQLAYASAVTVTLTQTNSVTTFSSVNVTASTTVYAVAMANFSAGTVGAFGKIHARRVYH